VTGDGKARVCFCKQSACTVLNEANVRYVIIASDSEHESPSRAKRGRAIAALTCGRAFTGWVGGAVAAVVVLSCGVMCCGLIAISLRYCFLCLSLSFFFIGVVIWFSPRFQKKWLPRVARC